MKSIQKNVAIIIIISMLSCVFAFPSLAEAADASSGTTTDPDKYLPSPTPVAPPAVYYNYTASGTIHLPNGIVAPKDGINVYAAFGGIIFDDLNYISSFTDEVQLLQETEGTASGSTSGGGGSGGVFIITIPDEAETKYEEFKIAATVPEGETSVNYECTFSLPASYAAFYGKFWVYDNANCNISNKMVVSSLSLINPGITRYENINATLTSKTATINGAISIPGESPLQSNLDVFIIAKNNYNTFITKTLLSAGEYVCEYSLYVEGGSEYSLSYYIPSSTDYNLQKVKTGTFQVTDISAFENVTVNSFELFLQPIVKGVISLPNNSVAPPGGVDLNIYSDYNSIRVHIPQGYNSVDYQIGVEENNDTYIECEVINSKIYGGGYYSPDGPISDSRTWFYVETEDVGGIDLTLLYIFTIYGNFSLPSSLSMDENTYFRFYLYAKNINNDKVYSTTVTMYSDVPQAEYSIAIPKEEITGQWILYYNFGDVVTIPVSPYNPIRPLRASGGGSSGGGGSWSSTGYYYQEPENLMKQYNIYYANSGVSIRNQNTKVFTFEGDCLNENRTLLAQGEETSFYTIGGYFSSAITIPQSGINVTVSLVNESGSENSISFLYTGGNKPYILETETAGNYKIKYNIDGEVFYFQNNYLISDIANATVISTDTAVVQYKKDVYYKNCFPIDARAYCKNTIEYNIKVYDINGNLMQEVPSNNYFYVTITPFVIGIGGVYFTKFDGTTFSGLTPNINEAMRVNSSYRDYLTRDSGYFSIDTNYEGNIEDGTDEKRPNWLDDGNFTEPILNGSAFEINTAQELAWVSYKVMTGSTFINKTVKLMNDIDLSEYEWTPIGGFNGTATDASKVFRGVFDGQGFTIRGLNIGTNTQSSNYEYCGLFGYASGTDFKNIKLSQVEVYSSGAYTGGFIGYIRSGLINKVEISGIVKGSINTGGLAAYSDATTIRNCSSSATVAGGSGYDCYASPLVGYGGGRIENSYSVGSIASAYRGGGIAGYFFGDIQNCYSASQLNGGSVGGIAYGAPNTQYCYYNNDMCSKGIYSGTDNTIPKTTAQMQSNDFKELLNDNANQNWNDWIIEGEGYPTITKQANRFWQACNYDLTETNNTYSVSTPEELAWIAGKVNNGMNFSGKSIVLNNNIDLGGKYWIPIGNEAYSFSGTFDGNNCTISNMKIGDGKYPASYVGLFGYISGGKVLNTTLNNVNVFGNSYVGALAGRIYNSSYNSVVVDKCSAQGNIAGFYYVGGLIGYFDDYSGTVSNSFSLTKVTGDNRVGGLIGHLYGTINNSYSISEVDGNGEYIGGLIGYFEYCSANTCFSKSSVKGQLYVGGLFGYTDDSTINNCFWNIDMPQAEDGFTLPNGGKKGIGYGNGTVTSLTSEQMKIKQNFNGWDFVSTWTTNNSYPVLQWQVEGTLPNSYLLSDVSIIGNNVVLNVTKTFNKTQTNKIVYAAYDSNGVLIDTICNDISMSNGTKLFTSSRSFNFSANKTASKIKIFIWDNLTQMNPLSAIETKLVSN